VVTYARLPARELYHVSKPGIDTGIGRGLAFAGFPAAPVAVAVVWLLAEHLTRRMVTVAAVTATVLASSVFWPGAVDEADPDSRPISVLALIALVAVVALTVGVARSAGLSRPRLLRQHERVRLALFGLVFLVEIPWLAALIGVSLDHVPVLNSIYLSDSFVDQPGVPGLHPAVHAGLHHGLCGALLVTSGLWLSRHLRQMGSQAHRRILAGYLSLLIAYGGANALQDFWLEQIVKRDLVGWQFPYMLQPKASWAFAGILAGAALIYWTLERSSRNRVDALVLIAVVLGLAAYAGTAAPDVAAAPASRPNIVLILSDDQRWDTLWGMPTVEGALAGNGVTFANSFVVNPLCCPSRASLLTGRYSHSTGVYLNRPPHGGFARFDDHRTIATVLHDAGYETGLFGKYLNDYGSRPADARYRPPGWDRWSVFLGGPRYYDYRLTSNGVILEFGHRTLDYSTSVLARQAAQFVRSARRPFFLLLAPYAPHEPAIPPPGYKDAFAHFSWWQPPSFNERDLSDKPAYIRRLGSLTPRQVARAKRFRREQLEAALAVDDAVRSVLKTLEQRGALDNTFIVYTSDNGVAWGEHPLIAARKLVPYEEPIRVPLVIRYDPLVHEQPSQDGHLVLNIDLASTLAAVAGTRMPGAQGRNLLPLLASHRPIPWRSDFLIEHLAGPPQRDVPTYCAVRTERYKYVLYQTREEELYDLLRDPHELNNIASHRAAATTKIRLRRRLAQLCRPVPPGYTALSVPRAKSQKTTAASPAIPVPTFPIP
jgi:N-acetylglucosamine-6-sulfatase